MNTASARTIAKESYKQKLLDPRWQKKRLEILHRDDFRCRVCNDGASTLHVHHKAYIHGRAPWDYEDEYFIALCDKCHEKAHKRPVVIDTVRNAPAWIEYHDDGKFGCLFRCPYCGGNYLSHALIYVFNRKSEDSVDGLAIEIAHQKIRLACGMESNPSPHRNAILAELWCEQCGETANLAIHQHKGQTFISLERNSE